VRERNLKEFTRHWYFFYIALAIVVFRESEKEMLKMKSPIRITKARHRGEDRLFISFEYDKELIGLVKKVEGATWSAFLIDD